MYLKSCASSQSSFLQFGFSRCGAETDEGDRHCQNFQSDEHCLAYLEKMRWPMVTPMFDSLQFV